MKSRYKCVYWDKKGQDWIAQISHNRKLYYLGRFDDEYDAHLAVIRTKESFKRMTEEDINKMNLLKHSEKEKELQNSRDELMSIKIYVNKLTGINISSIKRDNYHAFARSIYCKIARELTPLSLREIGLPINRNHATVLHSLKMFDEVVENEFYAKIYLGYGGISDSKLKDKVGKIDKQQQKIEELLKENRILKEKEVANSFNLTPNEIAYRKLTTNQRFMYDKRAELILKSFKWITRDKTQTIECQQ